MFMAFSPFVYLHNHDSIIIHKIASEKKTFISEIHFEPFDRTGKFSRKTKKQDGFPSCFPNFQELAPEICLKIRCAP